MQTTELPLSAIAHTIGIGPHDVLSAIIEADLLPVWHNAQQFRTVAGLRRHLQLQDMQRYPDPVPELLIDLDFERAEKLAEALGCEVWDVIGEVTRS